MAWLEAHQQLERHPKTTQLAAEMVWSVDETIGKLMRFWWWCLDYAPTGDLRKFNDAVLGGSVGLSADSSSKFVRSMVAAGWLDRGNGVFRVHDWPHYAGRYLKDSKFKRCPERWQEVVALYKMEVSSPSEACPRTVGGLSPLPDQPNPPGSPPPRAGEVAGEESDELLTAAQAAAQAANAGVPEDFARFVFDDWHSRGGRDSGGVKVAWAGYVKKRWNREQAEWRAGTHRGKNNGGPKNGQRKLELDRDRDRTGLATTAGDGLRTL